MKLTTLTLLVLFSLLLSGLAMAGADDTKWVAKCISDNADAKVAPDVVAKYCACMNNQMDEKETQSISTWEKSHPAEMKACEKEAGWK